jgi:hypothetical protein
MNHLFTCNGPDNLLKDTNFKKYYPSVNAQMAFEHLEPYIVKAVEKYLKPYLGDFYESFRTSLFVEVVAPAVRDPRIVELGEYLRYALANYTIYDAMPHLNTVLSDMGVMQNSNDKAVPVEAWRYKNTRWQCLIEGDAMMDLALQYAEKHKLFFTDYESSTLSVWFKTSEDLKKYFNMSGRRAYLALEASIVEAEDKLACMIGATYTDLLARYYATPHTLFDQDEKLIRKIKAFIADYALEKSLFRISIMVDGDGLKVLSSTDGFNLRSNVLSTFGKDAGMLLKKELKLDVKSRIGDITSYLNDFASIYTSWTVLSNVASMVTVSDDSCNGAIGIG